jgi:hypothetical protein
MGSHLAQYSLVTQPSAWIPDDGELKTPKHVAYITNLKDNK